MELKQGYYKHKKLGFVIKVESWVKVSLKEWTPPVEIIVLKGEVVVEGNGGWPIGYLSNDWIVDEFELLTGDWFIEVDAENEMWDATNLGTKENYYGGYEELGSDKDRSYRIEIDWDSEMPVNYDEVEKQLKKLIYAI